MREQFSLLFLYNTVPYALSHCHQIMRQHIQVEPKLFLNVNLIKQDFKSMSLNTCCAVRMHLAENTTLAKLDLWSHQARLLFPQSKDSPPSFYCSLSGA